LFCTSNSTLAQVSQASFRAAIIKQQLEKQALLVKDEGEIVSNADLYHR